MGSSTSMALSHFDATRRKLYRSGLSVYLNVSDVSLAVSCREQQKCLVKEKYAQFTETECRCMCKHPSLTVQSDSCSRWHQVALTYCSFHHFGLVIRAAFMSKDRMHCRAVYVDTDRNTAPGLSVGMQLDTTLYVMYR